MVARPQPIRHALMNCFSSRGFKISLINPYAHGQSSVSKAFVGEVDRIGYKFLLEMLSYNFRRFILIFALRIEVFDTGDEAIKWKFLCAAMGL